MRIRMRTMSGHREAIPRHYAALVVIMLSILAACGNGGAASTTPTPSSAPKLAAKQILTFPNVGITDSGPPDPALVTDQNTDLIVNMIYSGLVKSDINLNVVPDQATWDVSDDNRVYTFHLKPGIVFSDGTPVTAQTYVYTLSRALLPEVDSSMAALFEGAIVGANAVMKGKTKTLSGVKAIDNQTLRITLTRPTPYFLQMLTNSLFFPLNKRIIDTYGQSDWPDHVVGSGVGTGPFMIAQWNHSVKMVLVPNPYYYGDKTKLTQVNMIFTNDATTALNVYRAGRYDFVWNMTVSDQVASKGLPGFTRSTQLETDALFFNNKMPPFDNALVRQAFAYATDKVTLAHNVFFDSVVPAQTIIPPGMPGYQPDYAGIPYDKNMAKSTAYADELSKHQVQFGFVPWNADFADPYDCLTLNLLSTAPNNYGQWSDPDFDQAVTQADKTLSNNTRVSLYNQAEQIAIQNVGWLPLDHQALAAIIPLWVHGVSVNANGLFFGDWSQVYVLQH
ncbi:MAG: peptide ABC transporter substrate-binding protein [Chloroflexi bacterium]|nr:MAG: peptide ABC transporter substrate-binding protein [Chloroflexota bacterium]